MTTQSGGARCPSCRSKKKDEQGQVAWAAHPEGGHRYTACTNPWHLSGEGGGGEAREEALRLVAEVRAYCELPAAERDLESLRPTAESVSDHLDPVSGGQPKEEEE